MGALRRDLSKSKVEHWSDLGLFQLMVNAAWQLRHGEQSRAGTGLDFSGLGPHLTLSFWLGLVNKSLSGSDFSKLTT